MASRRAGGEPVSGRHIGLIASDLRDAASLVGLIRFRMNYTPPGGKIIERRQMLQLKVKNAVRAIELVADELERQTKGEQ